MRVELNPPGDANYLAALNLCFGGWGDEAAFDWYFRTAFAGRPADRFLLRDGGELLAGSAVSWRELADAGGKVRLAGIMTGSWTLPHARGRGCFRRLVAESRRLCAERGAAWLLAFVTHDNASRRVLEAAGAAMVPTRYLWSRPAEVPARSPVASPVLVDEVSDRLTVDWLERRDEAGAGCLRFHYPDPGSWRRQFMERPLPSQLLEFRGRGAAVVERHAVFDRMLSVRADGDGNRLAVEQQLHARAVAAGRGFFAFTASRAHADALAEACVLDGTDGYLTVLAAAEPPPGPGAPWFVEAGDRL